MNHSGDHSINRGPFHKGVQLDRLAQLTSENLPLFSMTRFLPPACPVAQSCNEKSARNKQSLSWPHVEINGYHIEWPFIRVM